jgi:hypothetical protein
VDTKAAEPDEVAAMRGMTPEERRILLRLMHEAEPEAARGAPEGGRLGLVSQGDRAPACTSPLMKWSEPKPVRQVASEMLCQERVNLKRLAPKIPLA